MLFISPCFGQGIMEKKFYNDQDVLTDSLHASKYKVYAYKDQKKKAAIVTTYMKNGQIKSQTSYSNVNTLTLDGISRVYHENGKLWLDYQYKKNYLDGKIMSYYENGNTLRIDYYKAGKFVHGNCYTAEGKDTIHFDREIRPEYPGGAQALYQFLGANVYYPAEARNKGIKGEVVLQFIVDRNGDVTDIEVIRSPHQLLSDEAIRVVKLLDKWQPAQQEGYKVKVRYTLPMKFKLE